MGVGLGSNNLLNKVDDDKFGSYKDKSNTAMVITKKGHK